MICSPKFPLAKFKELTPQQLTDYPYVSREPGSGTREFTDDYLRKAGIAGDQMKLVMETGQPDCRSTASSRPASVSPSPRSASVRKAQRLGDLVAIPLKPRLIRTLSMVYPKEKFRSRLVTDLRRFRLRQAQADCRSSKRV